jgi:hypothetical protein
MKNSIPDDCTTSSFSLSEDFWEKLDKARARRTANRRRSALGRHIPIHLFHTRRTHQARVRARRSPASQRRATADSGGTDGDGGGDPEPPRPRSSSSLSPYAGGAL